MCGGPIEVPPGTFGVRCSYCGSDNVVPISLAQVKEGEERFRAQRDLVEMAEIEEGAARRQASANVLRIVLVTVGIVVPSSMYALSVAVTDSQRNWGGSVDTDPRLVLSHIGQERMLAVRRGESLVLSCEPCTFFEEVYVRTEFGRKKTPPWKDVRSGRMEARVDVRMTGWIYVHQPSAGQYNFRVER